MRGFILIVFISLLLTSVAYGEESTEVTEEVPVVTARQVVVEYTREHFDLHKRGLRFRVTHQRRMKKLHVDIEGPITRGAHPGFRVTVRF